MPPLSPNYGERRGGLWPTLIVLHYTAMESCDAALARLCDPLAEVSAHYLISETGEVLPLVAEDMRAWHAGAGQWQGFGDINSRSIGIELANTGAQPFANGQMRGLECLLGDVMVRWNMGPAAVIAHSDMAPGRKSDPGARFDWCRLALGGLSVWPQNTKPGRPKLCAPDDFIADARRFGYPDVSADIVLAAFRLRFRPWAKGPLDTVDAELIADLADRFGVDETAPLAYCPRRADGWMTAGGNTRGKSGLHEDRVPGNARPGQPEGKRHREETAVVLRVRLRRKPR